MTVQLFDPVQFPERRNPVTNAREYYFNAEQLLEETKDNINIVGIKGTVAESRISSFIEGEELDRFNKRRTYAVDKPICFIKLENPQIIPRSKDAHALNVNEMYVLERFYVSSNKDDEGNVVSQRLMSSHEHKGKRLPEVWRFKTPEELAASSDNSRIVKEPPLPLDQELAPGTDVYIQLRVYRTNYGEKRGIAVQQVCINGTEYSLTPRRGTNNPGVQALNEYALTYASTITPTVQQNIVQPAVPVPAQPVATAQPQPVPAQQQYNPAPQVAQPQYPSQPVVPQGVPQPQVAQPQPVTNSGSPFQSTPLPSAEADLPFEATPQIAETPVSNDGTLGQRPITFQVQEF